MFFKISLNHCLSSCILAPARAFQRGFRGGIWHQRNRLNRKVLSIALPALLAMVSHTAVMISDTVMVGRLGTEAIAATGLGGFFIYTIISIFMGISIAVQIITARRVGEHHFEAGLRLLYVSIFWVGLIGSLLSLGGLWYAEKIAALFVPGEADRTLRLLTQDYIVYRLYGLPLYVIGLSLRGFFDGLGLTVAGMAAAGVSTVANIFFNWVLIYGHLGFGAYGVKGASAASSLSAVVWLIVFLFFFFHGSYKKARAESRRREAENISKDKTGQSKAGFGALSLELFGVGSATASQEFLVHFSFLLLYRIAAVIGAVTVASTNILISLISLSFMPGLAFGIAATTILGQAIGKKKYREGEKGVERAALFAVTVMGSIGLVFIVAGKQLLRAFTHEQAVIEETYRGLVIVSLVQIADGMHMVYGSALRGAGMVRRVFFYYIIASYLLMLPLAWLLGVHFKLESEGLWSAVSVWILFLGIVYFRIFRSRSWRGYEV